MSTPMVSLATLLVPPAITCLVLASLLTLTRAASDTSELPLATIALLLSVAASYAALYNFSLWKAGRQ
jgi:hypothetical protein